MDAFERSSDREGYPLADAPQRERLIPPNGDGNGGENGNGGYSSNPNLRVAGIEATQGTQFFNFNGQGTGTGGDNSLTLVPRKMTVFRVYADVSAQAPDFPVPSSLSGALRVYRFHWPQAPHYELVDTLAPLVSPIAAKPASALQRANALDTLNFRLNGFLSQPGNTGQLAVSATVFDAAHPNDPVFFSDSVLRYFSFLPPGVDARLPIQPVRILYTGPGAPPMPEAPSDNEVTATLSSSFVTATYPVEGINYAGPMLIMDFNGDLTAAPSAASQCSPGWDDLLQRLRKMRSASYTSDIYVGLLDTNTFFDATTGAIIPGTPLTVTPGGGVVAGCGGRGVAAGYVFDPNPGNFVGQAAQVTMAHEIGHAMGRLHAPCPGSTAGGIDPSYPAYVTGPAGTIGEVGFDCATGTTRPPGVMSATFDFMASCSPTWVSPYTYRALYWNQHIITA
jgi:hypothetical protein